MPIIADIDVTPDEGMLEALTETGSDEVVRVPFVLTESDAVAPYLLVSRAAVASVRGTLLGRRRIDAVDAVDEVADHTLVRVRCPRGSDTLFAHLADVRIDVLEGVGTSDEWAFRVRSPDRKTLETFVDDRRRRGETISIERVRERVDDGGRAPTLTPAQVHTLRTAYDAGYFEVPREASLIELSETLGVSDSAVSQRLRRGIDSLLAERFAEDDDPRSEK